MPSGRGHAFRPTALLATTARLDSPCRLVPRSAVAAGAAGVGVLGRGCDSVPGEPYGTQCGDRRRGGNRRDPRGGVADCLPATFTVNEFALAPELGRRVG